MKKSFFTSFFIIIFILIAPVRAERNDLAWIDDMNSGMKKAKRTGRPMMVFFYADWCGYCIKMQRDVFPSYSVRNEGKKFINIKVNDKHRKVLSKYLIRSFPVMVFLDKNGYELERISGFVNPGILARKMRDVFIRRNILEKYKKSLKKYPKSPILNYRMGLYYSGVGLHRKSLIFFMKAWKSKGKKSSEIKRDSLFNTAICYMQLKQFVASSRYWTIYIKNSKVMNADYAYARFYRGLSYKNSGNKKKAIIDLEYAGRYLPGARDRRVALRALASLK